MQKEVEAMGSCNGFQGTSRSSRLTIRTDGFQGKSRGGGSQSSNQHAKLKIFQLGYRCPSANCDDFRHAAASIAHTLFVVRT